MSGGRGRGKKKQRAERESVSSCLWRREAARGTSTGPRTQAQAQAPRESNHFPAGGDDTAIHCSFLLLLPSCMSRYTPSIHPSTHSSRATYLPPAAREMRPVFPENWPSPLLRSPPQSSSEISVISRSPMTLPLFLFLGLLRLPEPIHNSRKDRVQPARVGLDVLGNCVVASKRRLLFGLQQPRLCCNVIRYCFE